MELCATGADLLQVDFVKEAAHIAQFSEYLDRMDLRGIATCPFVYPQQSSTRLLTLERLEGVPLTDLEVRLRLLRVPLSVGWATSHT